MDQCVSQGCAAKLKTLVEEKDISVNFQPIFRLALGEVMAYEGLIRGPQDTLFTAPEKLFECAGATNLVDDLELCCIQSIIQSFSSLDTPSLLFLNICSPAWLTSIPAGSPDYEHMGQRLIALLEQAQIPPQNLVLELSERLDMRSYDLIDTPLGYCRAKGIRIAIDDFGTGYSGLERCFALQPEFIKLDKCLLDGVDQRPEKQACLKGLLDMAREMHAEVIAEGVETQAQLDLLHEYHAPYAQGYFLGRPHTTEAFQAYSIGPCEAQTTEVAIVDTGNAGSLVVGSPQVPPEMPMAQVLEVFSRLPKLLSLPVVASGKLLGVAHRSDVMERLALPFGRSLYESKPISEFTAPYALVVEASLSLDRVSKLVTSMDSDALLNELVIVEGDTYIGIGRVKDLLEQITNARLLHARHANPLTLLPGNLPLHRHIDQLIDQQAEFAVAYFDLNNFKPFNDFLGYSKGDEVICLVAQLIEKYVKPNAGFISHIGGDDFMVVFNSTDWMSMCCAILEDFDFQVRRFFPQEALADGGFYSKDRQGNRCFHRITSLSIGVVEPQKGECTDHHKVSELAAKAKKRAKASDGSSIYCLPPR